MTKKAKYSPHSTAGDPSNKLRQGTENGMDAAKAAADAQLAQAQADNARDLKARQAVAAAAEAAVAPRPLTEVAGKASSIESVTKP